MADDLVSCDLEGETALMSVDQGKYYGLDPIGSRIWALLEQARPVVDLCALLLRNSRWSRPSASRMSSPFCTTWPRTT